MEKKEKNASASAKKTTSLIPGRHVLVRYTGKWPVAVDEPNLNEIQTDNRTQRARRQRDQDPAVQYDYVVLKQEEAAKLRFGMRNSNGQYDGKKWVWVYSEQAVQEGVECAGERISLKFPVMDGFGDEDIGKLRAIPYHAWQQIVMNTDYAKSFELASREEHEAEGLVHPDDMQGGRVVTPPVELRENGLVVVTF